MSQELRKRKDAYEKDFDSYAKVVNQPEFICTQCGRAANKKKYVWHPH